MVKRTTIEIDEELLSRAKLVLNLPTTRATVEEALRRAVDDETHTFEDRKRKQLDYLKSLADNLDLDVLRSDEMWR